MRKAIYSIIIIVVLFSFVACNQGGNINNVKVSIDNSNKFSYEEINDAVDSVKDKFKSDFKGCKLNSISYNEVQSDSYIEGYLEYGKGSIDGVTSENVLVLESDFDVSASVEDGGLTPNTTYSNWKWTLIRESKTDNWKIDDWGY